MSVSEQLLAVQRHDTALDQLTHRRANLPARAELRAIEASLASLARERHAIDEQRSGDRRQQKRLEDEIATLNARAADLERKLAVGTVPRELQALTHDLDSVRTKVAEMEDAVLALMERADELDARTAGLDAREAPLDQQAAEGRVLIAETEASIDAELARERAARAEAAAAVAPEALARYERLRSRFSGVAVAELVRNRCSGCSLELSAVDIAQAKAAPPDAVLECPNCGRLLVRT